MLHTLLMSLVGSTSLFLPLRIDLGMDTRRSDTANPRWDEWQVPDGSVAHRHFGSLEITLRAADGQQIRGQWHKPGLATGAKLATDGVSVSSEQSDATLELIISGLSAGQHTLVTYHNAVMNEAHGDCELTLDGELTRDVTPTTRVASNELAASCYFEFEAVANRDVVVRISASGSNSVNRVVLNGFEIDGYDPKRKALLPSPSDGDWHANADSGEVKLSWKPAGSAVEHRLYVASDIEPSRAVKACYDADQDSDFLVTRVKGGQHVVRLDPKHLQQHHCWRVDSIDEQGQVTRGDVWQFRTRRLAFPGAEGYGRFAIGGRRGRVLKVTQLGDSGPGSLRAAIEAEGPRTIVFDIGGRIVLQDRLVIRNPFLTIAGQTAPGRGICISNYNLGMLGTHDCIVRFLRVRPGGTAGKTLDGMGMASTDHSIVDHCSISWTQDEAFSSRGAKNITLQRTLISEALNVAGHKKYKQGTQHGYAASIGGDIGSFHHNLLAHCAGRNWSLAGGIDQAKVHAGRLDIRNNVVYNWSHRTTDGGARQVNFVNNYYRPGPASKIKTYLNPQFENPAFGPQQYYIEGNVMEGVIGPEGPEGDLRGVKVRGKQDAPVRVREPFFAHHVSTQTAEVALEDVLADVGCNRPALDDHDQRIIEETRERSHRYSGSVSGLPGLPDSQEDVGGWEDYSEARRADTWDTDGDGLPNWWEKKHQLNTESPADDLTETHADPDGNGYTHLEEYLHWMATRGNEVPR